MLANPGNINRLIANAIFGKCAEHIRLFCKAICVWTVGAEGIAYNPCGGVFVFDVKPNFPGFKPFRFKNFDFFREVLDKGV